MTTQQKDPAYFTIPGLSKRLVRSQTDIKADLLSGAINQFQFLHLRRKAQDKTTFLPMLLAPLINKFARENLLEGPANLIFPYNKSHVVLDDSKLDLLKANIDSDSLYKLWLKAFGVSIFRLKTIIPCEEVYRYEEYLDIGEGSIVSEAETASLIKKPSNLPLRTADYIGKKQLRQKLGNASDSTIWRWVQAGRLPKPRQIGPNRIAWLLQELDQVLESFPVASGVIVAPGAKRGRKSKNHEVRDTK